MNSLRFLKLSIVPILSFSVISCTNVTDLFDPESSTTMSQSETDTSTQTESMTNTETQTGSQTLTETETETETDVEIELSKITAQEASLSMGAGFNLGQMFDNDQHTPTLAEAKHKIDAYYAQGFRNVRIPVSWTVTIDGNKLANASGNIDLNNTRLQELVKVVDYSLSLEGMYVVINAHHEKEIKDNNQLEVLATLWNDITTLFKDRENRLLFELLNEPHLSDSSAMPPENLRAMTKAAYDKVRAINPNRIILIGGNQWFGAHEMAVVWKNLDDVGAGQDPYLMATFHHYNPWNYHGEAELMFDWNDTHISSPMDQMKNWANSVGQGMPIYIGEWGTNWGETRPTMDCNNIRNWYEKFDFEFASVNGMPTAVWDDGGWFKIFDHGTDSFNNNLSQCIITGSCDYAPDDESRFNSACEL